MADVSVDIQQVIRAGLTPSYQGGIDAADTFHVQNNGAVLLHVKNGGTASTLTIKTQGTVDGLAVADRTVAVPEDTELFIGPFAVEIYNDPDRQVEIEFSTPATVEFAAIRV